MHRPTYKTALCLLMALSCTSCFELGETRQLFMRRIRPAAPPLSHLAMGAFLGDDGEHLSDLLRAELSRRSDLLVIPNEAALRERDDLPPSDAERQAAVLVARAPQVSLRRVTQKAEFVGEGQRAGVALHEHLQMTVSVTLMANSLTGETLYSRILEASVRGPDTVRIHGQAPLPESDLQLRLSAYEKIAEVAALLIAGDTQQVTLPFYRTGLAQETEALAAFNLGSPQRARDLCARAENYPLGALGRAKILFNRGILDALAGDLVVGLDRIKRAEAVLNVADPEVSKRVSEWLQAEQAIRTGAITRLEATL